MIKEPISANPGLILTHNHGINNSMEGPQVSQTVELEAKHCQ